jgi:hypothetical protein
MLERRKVSDETLLQSYRITNSVWKTGQEVGLCGQSVHERLVKLNIIQSAAYSDEDKARVLAEYESHADRGKLDELAKMLNRSKPNLARFARRFGLTKQNRTKPYLADSMSEIAFQRWHSLTKEQQALHGINLKKGWKAAWREIGGKRSFYRSAWEANYARYLEWLQERGEIKSWEHEPHTFWFLQIKRGTRSYLPDFLVVENNGSESYHEVKGWMSPASKTKIKRMAKYYPEVRLILIDKKVYKSIADKIGRLIPGWE